MRSGTKASPLAAALVLTVVASVFGASGHAVAEEEAVDESDSGRFSLLEGWSPAVELYLWLPEVHGPVTVGGASLDVDLTNKDELDLLGDGFSMLAGGANLEAARGGFFVFGGVFAAYAHDSEGARLKGVDDGPVSISDINVEAKADIDLVLADFGVGYRVLELALPHRSRPLVLDAFLAGRYYYVWVQAKVKTGAELQRLIRGPEIRRAAGRKTGDVDWADPLIGARWTLPILECLDLRFRGDIGGFHVASDLAWSIEGLLQYHLPWHPYGADTAVLLGYKALGVDYETGRSEIDVTFQGPIGMLSARF